MDRIAIGIELKGALFVLCSIGLCIDLKETFLEKYTR